jgi:hypothetical protein
MSTNLNIRAIDNPVDKSGGLVWHRLRSEREDICEALTKESVLDFGSGVTPEGMSHEDAVATANWHKQLLLARLNKIDEALDRLMSGSYGNCCKCGRWIEDSKLDFDPAVAFCLECWRREQSQTRTDVLAGNKRESCLQAISQSGLLAGVALETLKPFDTICVRTVNSDYRICLLEPSSRALVEGGYNFAEPVEAMVNGSTFDGYTLRGGWIGVGLRLGMWVNDRLVSTSPVQSIRVEHHSSSEPASVMQS